MSGAETFRLMLFGWDVRRAMELVEGREATATVAIAGYADTLLGGPDGHGLIYVDWQRAATDPDIDLTKPLIAVVSPLGRDGSEALLVIDGNHRIAKARIGGVEELPAHVLSAAEERQVRDPRAHFEAWDEAFAELAQREAG